MKCPKCQTEVGVVPGKYIAQCKCGSMRGDFDGEDVVLFGEKACVYCGGEVKDIPPKMDWLLYQPECLECYQAGADY